MVQIRSIRVLAATVLSIPFALASTSVALATKQGFEVQNNTSVDLTYLYISASSSDSWGPDILGNSQVLAPGDYIINQNNSIFSDPSPNVCLYDFRGEFSDGDVVEEYQFNVCEHEAFQFYEYYE